MNWPLIPQQIATGILNGGIIALIALGVVLIFKSSEVFNFSQGHLVMLGAYLTWWFAGGSEDEEAFPTCQEGLEGSGVRPVAASFLVSRSQT